MYCHKCGNKLVKGATFCSYCGTRVEFAFDNDDNAIESKQSLDIVSSNIEPPPKQNNSLNENIVNENKGESFFEKVKSKAQTIGWFILVLTGAAGAKVIGRNVSKSYISQYGPGVVLSYAVPGLICGVLFGVIPYALLKKRKDVKLKDCYLIFLINGLLGVYGGIPFSIGGALVLSVIVFLITRNE